MCRTGKKIFPFLLFCFLFTQYLYADQNRFYVSMVIGNATTNVDLATTLRHGQVTLIVPSSIRLGSDITPWQNVTLAGTLPA
jgi:hypothetical protein